MQPPLIGVKSSSVHSVPHTSHFRLAPLTMWKLNDPHGSQVLMPAIVFPDGAEITTSGRYCPSL